MDVKKELQKKHAAEKELKEYEHLQSLFTEMLGEVSEAVGDSSLRDEVNKIFNGNGAGRRLGKRLRTLIDRNKKIIDKCPIVTIKIDK